MAEIDPELIQGIKQRLEIIEANVAKAAEKNNRLLGDVLILAVSKRQPMSVIEAGYACGLRSFGENYVEEARTKISQLADLRQIR